MDLTTFQKLGFSDKLTRVYLSLLASGPSSVRNLAKKAELNRGVVYEGLKALRDKGLVTYYEKEAKQYFVAESPEKLERLLGEQMEDLRQAQRNLEGVVKELKSVYDQGNKNPVARYYEQDDIKTILEDVLATCERTGINEYRVYSDARIGEYLYGGFETFSDARVAKGIAVRVVAIGSGGELRGLDERKWLTKKSATPTYIIIYPGKTAYISLSEHNELVGVVIENAGIAETEQSIFDALWASL